MGIIESDVSPDEHDEHDEDGVSLLSMAIVLVVVCILVLFAASMTVELTNTKDWISCVANGGHVLVNDDDGRERSWCDYGDDGLVVGYYSDPYTGEPTDEPNSWIFVVPIENPIWLDDPGPQH